MVVLSWIASLVGVISLILFIYWLFKAEKLKAKFLRSAFIAGFVIFSGFFVVFTAHTLSVIPERTKAKNVTPLVELGKKSWHKYVCIDCHTLLGNGAYYAPDLTKAWDRFVQRAGDEESAEATMIVFLQNPPQPTSQRRGMPNYGMSDEEAKGITHFLKWIASIDTNDWPPKPSRPVRDVGLTGTLEPVAPGKPKPSPEHMDEGTVKTSEKMEKITEKGVSPLEIIELGKTLFTRKGCKGCHTIGGGRSVGPDLVHLPPDHHKKFVVSWLLNPDSVYKTLGKKPIHKGYPAMPRIKLTEKEAEAVAEFLIAEIGRR